MVYDLAPELATAQPGQLRAARLPDLRAVVRLGTDPAPGMLTWDELLQMAMQAGEVELLARQAELQFDDPINIQYTSGTTGAPKGATLSHHNVLNNAYFTGKLQRFTDQDRVVAPVPLYHIFGCVLVNLACITHGATMIYPSNSFDPAATLEAVQAERATALYGVPTMFIAELSLPEFSSYDLRSLRTGLIGGAPCPVEVMKQIKTLMHIDEIEIIYGMTETGPLSFQTRIGTSLEKQVGTVGQVHPHVEVKIVDPDSGQLVPIGTSGELCTRGYSVMLGYWNNADATGQAIDSAHWMHTGDLAVMDAEGYVNIIGRSKDMIIRGGENVYPREIEEFLYTNPKIQDVQVIGVPDLKYGEEIMAWIKLRDGATATAEELRAFCRDRIAHFKIPRYVKFVDSFPMTVSGKTQKFVMREQSTRELGLAAAAELRTA